MSDDRDLADAIYAEITTPERTLDALVVWHDPRLSPDCKESDRMAFAIAHIAAAAIDAVLTRRRDAARTGPWDGTP